ncbi:SusD/RagB family nutrient-binding outer membrane lipoprotein [uncultured Draconibacterium sp.]|uniref:SusD/RagB family nutrient-binding outer membrane lipoprotein n=1 Tax=uncultured Draconibacterium sp. TaxID=1573823 RepID=UPI0029C75FC4|nr:SusD/RagB family nutrient-binding outer membrane lipoprotein [uncultured Draconibacterium sp.]
MKTIKYIYKLILVFGLMGALSCTDGFEDFNKDPNAFNEAPPENLFAGVVKSTLDLVGGVLEDNLYSQYASYQGGKGGQFQRFGYTEGVDGYWQRFYVDILKNNQEIIDNFGDNPEYANRVQIAKIWKSYVYSVMVSTFGGVPLSDAFGDGTTVSYDSEEAVYEAVLNMLKEASETIDPAGDRLGLDPVFNGDNNMWIKFANSLRLKIALRISVGFPQLAQEHGPAVMSNESGLISSNNENIYMQWGAESETWSYNYNRYVFSNLGQARPPFINDNFLLNLKTYKDPRMSVLAEPNKELFYFVDTMLASGSTTDTVLVSYGIPYVGRGLGDRALDEWDLNANDNITNGIPDAQLSTIGAALFLAPEMKFYIITNAEMNFMKAEAKLKGWGGNKTPEEYYYAGIDASFIQFGVSGADVYKEQDGIKWGTESAGLRDLFGIITSGISSDPLDKIVRQRWIAMFNQGHDAWCMQKRTRLLPFTPHTNPDGSYNETYVEIPERMIYPPVEVGINPDGYNAAVAAIPEGDYVTSPIQMNKSYERVQWEFAPAEYNHDFCKHWYGNSVDDLIAAGVDYEIISEDE